MLQPCLTNCIYLSCINTFCKTSGPHTEGVNSRAPGILFIKWFYGTREIMFHKHGQKERQVLELFTPSSPYGLGNPGQRPIAENQRSVLRQRMIHVLSIMYAWRIPTHIVSKLKIILQVIVEWVYVCWGILYVPIYFSKSVKLPVLNPHIHRVI